ncbi:hypothetical protein CSIM01_03241 [Colletotrichum simmondsii]|uniref:Uncharacterized protein n=1 Tax=Colletotrichum simmondsii TaxID=703756 RepID=A0A135SC46_9PEZI|nr:hypothetical protein CSIM01_03241 [Colletotrichum simmondsii]
MAMVMDVVNNKAGIPGSGDVPVAITFTSDLAKFVAAALTLLNWEQKTYLTGDKLAWNQLVELAEAVKGITFDVFRDSIETLKAELGTQSGTKALRGAHAGVFDSPHGPHVPWHDSGA